MFLLCAIRVRTLELDSLLYSQRVVVGCAVKPHTLLFSSTCLMESLMQIVRTLIFLYFVLNYSMSRVMIKPAFCICENKDAEQLRGT